MTWEAARDSCNDLGATLTSITDEDEQNFVAGLIGRSSWIGLSDQAEEGTFVWEDGSDLDYTKWEEGEPNNGNKAFGIWGGENCVQMRKKFGYMWNDDYCDSDNIFVCERP